MDTNIPDLLKDSHQDIDALFQIVLPFAVEMLNKYGSYYPFGAYMSVAGNISAIAGYDEQEEGDLRYLIDLLIAGLRKDAQIGRIKAAAVCTAVYVQLPQYTDEVSAIQVYLDHADGEAIDVFLPFTRNNKGEIHYEEAYTTESVSQIFPKFDEC